MTSRATPRFWAAYRALAEEARQAAQKAYRLFLENPRHPSLQFKRVHAREPIASVRVTLGYRALGLVEDDGITWFWIGNHADYERLRERLWRVGSTAATTVCPADGGYARLTPITLRESVRCNGRRPPRVSTAQAR